MFGFKVGQSECKICMCLFIRIKVGKRERNTTKTTTLDPSMCHFLQSFCFALSSTFHHNVRFADTHPPSPFKVPAVQIDC